MKFVEERGANWAAVQIRAVEMEIEQQKREWEEKRLAQKQLDDIEKQRTEKEDNEILTYSREDALNKVNIRSRTKSQVLGKRKSETANHSPKESAQGKKSNGTEVIRNGRLKEPEKKMKMLKSPPKNVESPIRRNTRNASNLSLNDKSSLMKATPRMIQRGTSRKSDRSTSINSHARSTSESTSRSTADSMSHQTANSTNTPDESDSECSLDVMIDSNDVNDSDSNSNAKQRSRFDSTSQDDDTLLNDDSTMTDETTIENMSKNLKESASSKATSSPRTRSRGTVTLNLWSLDDSPILAPKRQKSMHLKSTSDVKDDKELKANFGVKECKVSVVDCTNKKLKPPESPMLKPSPKARPKNQSSAQKNNLDGWVLKSPPPVPKPPSDDPQPLSDKEEPEERIPVTRQRRNTILMQKTL